MRTRRKSLSSVKSSETLVAHIKFSKQLVRLILDSNLRLFTLKVSVYLCRIFSEKIFRTLSWQNPLLHNERLTRTFIVNRAKAVMFFIFFNWKPLNGWKRRMKHKRLSIDVKHFVSSCSHVNTISSSPITTRWKYLYLQSADCVHFNSIVSYDYTGHCCLINSDSVVN